MPEQEWSEAWARARKVAMEVQTEVQRRAQPWDKVWALAEAQARAQAQAEAEAEEAKVKARAVEAAAPESWAWAALLASWALWVLSALSASWALSALSAVCALWPLWASRASWWVWGREAEQAQARVAARAVVNADALRLAGALTWARRGQREEIVPAAVASPSTIYRILANHHRYGAARTLWHRSRETRDEYSCLIDFIAPITRLPFELLRQIFLIIIDEATGPPLELMLICKHWHAIVTTIWASLNLGTRTPIKAVISKLERNQWLDIVMDTDSDRGHFTPSNGAFRAIFAAIEATSRWRSLVVESFPRWADLPEDLVNRRLQECSNATMSRFTTFKIKSACETSPLLHGLLRILGTTAGPELTTVQVNSSNVISFLTPDYASIFRSVKVLSLDTPGMPNPVDLLPHLHQLETFTASYLSLPIYHSHADLPFVHTLRHLTLRAVSVQWMSGRTFHVLEDCTLISPLHRNVLHTFTTTLPVCKHLSFQGYPLEILGGVLTHKLNHFSVTCPGSFNGRGNQQLTHLSRHVLGEARLAPKILHISIEATNQAWINAFVFMPDLEELVISSAKPSSLGAKVFQSFIVQPVHASNLGVTPTPRKWHVPLCPSLQRFGLKYGRWLRPSEHFKLISDFASVIRSREHSNYPLQRFIIWMTSDQKVPLELIEESRMSREGLERLAKQSGIEEERPLSSPYGDWGRQEEDGGLASQDGGPTGGGQVEVKEFPRESGTNTLGNYHPSQLFSTLVESAAGFVRRMVASVK